MSEIDVLFTTVEEYESMTIEQLQVPYHCLPCFMIESPSFILNQIIYFLTLRRLTLFFFS